MRRFQSNKMCQRIKRCVSMRERVCQRIKRCVSMRERVCQRIKRCVSMGERLCQRIKGCVSMRERMCQRIKRCVSMRESKYRKSSCTINKLCNMDTTYLAGMKGLTRFQIQLNRPGALTMKIPPNR